MGLTGVIHRDAKGTFWFDDVPVRCPEDVPRRKAWKGTVWYAPRGIMAHHWATIMGPQDKAFGPAPGQLLGVNFKVHPKGSFKVLAASSWGVHDTDPNCCFAKIRDLQVETAACGMQVRNSVAATAMQAYMDHFDGKPGHPSIRQLPCRWRGMAHAALHGGPIAVLRASSPYAVQIDVRRAYLAALHQEVPVLGVENGNKVGGWHTHEGRKWSTVRRLTGFVDATVRVSLDSDPTGLPPLPVHTSVGAVFPTGTMRGVWTIDQVKDAEERGEVEVLTVHQFCFAARTQPLFAEIANMFQQLPKDLGKRLYTRFWGKFGSKGGYSACRSDEPRFGEVPLAGLWWHYDGVNLKDLTRPTYRPDLAAFISAHNHRRVLRTMRELAPGSVVGCHVDAIWTDDVVGASRVCVENAEIGGWRVKRRGKLRFYGTGAYDHEGDLGASGYDSKIHGQLSASRLEQWAANAAGSRRKMLLHTRKWTSDPAVDSQATSVPLHADLDTQVSPAEGATVYDRSAWTFGGWARVKPESWGPTSTLVPRVVEAGPDSTTFDLGVDDGVE